MKVNLFFICHDFKTFSSRSWRISRTLDDSRALSSKFVRSRRLSYALSGSRVLSKRLNPLKVSLVWSLSCGTRTDSRALSEILNGIFGALFPFLATSKGKLLFFFPRLFCLPWSTPVEKLEMPGLG